MARAPRKPRTKKGSAAAPTPEPELFPGPTPEPAPAPAPAPAPKPASAPAPAPGTRSRLSSLRAAVTSPTAKGLAGLAGLMAGGAAVAGLLRVPPQNRELDRAVDEAVRSAKGQRVAQILEEERLKRSLTQNQARLAQTNPTLYTSVMAGRKVPTGGVVLGGKPRMDLMRELAASMDSGAFRQKDPLSELMG